MHADRESLADMDGAAGDSPRRASLPITASEDSPESDEDDYDESVLPSIDPVTMAPIENPIRNRFCNHVFDELSMANYIEKNHEPK